MFKIAHMCEHDDGVESHCHWKTSGFYSHYSSIEPQVAAAAAAFVVEPYVVLLLELLQLTDVYYALHGGGNGVVFKVVNGW